jgi:hypothetical protein
MINRVIVIPFSMLSIEGMGVHVQNVIFHKMKIHDASYLPLFYILEGVKVGYFSSINRLFSHSSVFRTSASRCCANQL